MKLIVISVTISIVFFIGSSAITRNSFYKENLTSPSSVRHIRSAAVKRDKEIGQKLKLISKLMDDLKKRTNCSSGDVDIATHCRDHWVPETLLRLSVRIASRNNNDHATKREKKIHDQHIRINKLMEKLTDVTQCNGEKKEADPGERARTNAGNEVASSKVLKTVLAEKESKEDAKDTKEGEEKQKEEETTSDSDLAAFDTTTTASADDDAEAENDTGDETGDESDAGKESECDYSHFGDGHTMLLPPNDCKIHQTGITEEDKEDILRIHNTLRATVARGEETQGNPGPQPPAANMRELVWNDQLAEVAEAWAKQCKAEHDHSGARKICSRNYFVNQNLHFYYGFSPEVDWEKAITDWYVEVKDVPNDMVSSFRSLLPIKIGHYTQVVWGDTTEVGCGIVHYEGAIQGRVLPESKIYACNYGKAGNVKTMPVYIEGPPASQCPLGQSENYPDLCKPDIQNGN